jgi:hypothetical protein
LRAGEECEHQAGEGERVGERGASLEGVEHCEQRPAEGGVGSRLGEDRPGHREPRHDDRERRRQ